MHFSEPWFLASVAARTAIVFFVLWFGVRLLGKRQMGNMNLLDILMVLLAGNAIQNALTYGSGRLAVGLVSVGTLLVIDRLIGSLFVSRPSIEQRFYGQPVILVTHGQLDHKAMRREGIDEDEIMEAARGQGLSELSKVRLAILEDDGMISIIPEES